MDKLLIDEKVQRYAELAKTAYDKHSIGDYIRFGSSRYVVYEIVNDDTTSTTAVILKKLDTDKIVVVFKGTQEFRDITTDFNFLKSVEFGGVRVHSGFADAYNSISNRLRRIIIATSEIKQAKVTFVGHSLGGSLAVLAMYDLFSESQESYPLYTVSAYTFAAPKVFGSESIEVVNKAADYITRVVVRGDIIPTLPPKCVGNFSHTGNLVSVKSAVTTLNLLKKHSIINYIASTKNI